MMTCAMSKTPATEPTLGLDLLPGLRLSDPFMVASSHWTESEPLLKQLAKHRPSAVTLKTTSAIMACSPRTAPGVMRVFGPAAA